MRFHRRSLLTGAVALGACATMPKAPLHGHEIGIQLYALGPHAYDDLDATFAALAEIGYRKVEVSEGRKPASEVRAALDRAGLTCCSIHTAHGSTLGPDEAAAQAAAYAHAVGARYAGPSIFPFVRPPAGGVHTDGRSRITTLAAAYTRDDWLRASDIMNTTAEHFASAGIQYFYHNHNMEFTPFEGGVIFDLLLQNTDPRLVKLQVDVGWLAAAGIDAAPFLTAHADRVRLMHVKDLKAPVQPNFALVMEPTEVGSGMMDWPALLQVAVESGVEHFLVEQEPPFSRPEIEAARISFSYLQQFL